MSAPEQSAREIILARVARAQAQGAVTVPRDYHGVGERGGSDDDRDLVDMFCARVDEYRARVHRCRGENVGATVAAVVAGKGAARVLIAPGLPDELSAGVSAGIELVRDDPSLTSSQLDDVAAVLTVCACAVAVTGTVVLDHGPGQGRRALTLVPDHHVIVVRAEQIVYGVPDAIDALDPERPQTWISGPSATSDIELQRVEGVHGPRKLDVIVVE